MDYTIGNGKMQAVISDKGAELKALSFEGRNYLWERDPAVWGDSAPVLFPYVARMTNKNYTYKGKQYTMDIHGFAKDTVFAVEEQAEDRIIFRMEDTEETREQYPFSFVFRVTFAIEGTKLSVGFNVENRSDVTMPFGIGGHPGFHVPLDEELTFDDFKLEFGSKCQPNKIIFTDTCFVTDEVESFPLVEDRYLPLKHNLFDNDAIVLKDMADTVTICSEKSEHFVKVSFPGVPFLGLWHMPKTTAPYICIEPWMSLPSRDGVVEDLEEQPTLLKLESGKTYQGGFEITLQ